ncbi:hypothetical protein ACFVAO_29160, partial [Streptomyces californicus]|uniref:hypothetical protein n=1 Tax=Streptomyces californicus TaxID=67351 RepID=UPI003674C1BD
LSSVFGESAGWRAVFLVNVPVAAVGLVLAARTSLDAAIFATREGLPRAERELAAAATSKASPGP